MSAIWAAVVVINTPTLWYMRHCVTYTTINLRMNGLGVLCFLCVSHVGDRCLQHVESLVKLLVGDHQWHQQAQHVAERTSGKYNHSVFVAVACDPVGFVGGRLASTGLYQFDSAHAAESADIADDGPALLPVAGAFLEVVAQVLGAFAELLLPDGIDHGESGGAGGRIAGKCA